MAQIRPFKAYRPCKGMEERIAALPYDVYNRAEACEVVKKNPESFLAIDRAETQFGEEVDTYADCVYEKADQMLREKILEGKFVQDPTPCFYLYELTMDGHSQTGVVGCASIDDYRNNVIKKHENTRADKEEDRIRHVDTCSMQTGPIFLAYRAKEDLKEKIGELKKQAPVYDFVSEDGIGHRVWVIDNDSDVAMIEEAFGKIPAIYIADGHHRCASAVKVGLKRREQYPDYTGEEEFNYFLSVVFPYDQLCILPYNRVVHDLNGLTVKAFLAALKFNFELMLMPGFPCKPVEKHCMGMYVDGQWYHLKAWPDVYEGKDVVTQLDVSILQDKVLNPILGIQDPRTDQRISFVGGNHKAAELAQMADKTGGVAFVMYPTSMEDLMKIADESRLMPPKSTWFEPKLRSGLFIHKLY